MEAGDQQLVHSPFVPAGYWSPCAPLVWNPVKAPDIRFSSSPFRKQHLRHEKADGMQCDNYQNGCEKQGALQGLLILEIIRYSDINDETIAPDTGRQTETFLGSNLNWKNTLFGNDSKDDQISIEFEARQSLDSHEKIDGVIKFNIDKKLKFQADLSDDSNKRLKVHPGFHHDFLKFNPNKHCDPTKIFEPSVWNAYRSMKINQFQSLTLTMAKLDLLQLTSIPVA
ncbi:unnamed protein product [Schistosoma margrebowiei]|uniref:Uncharacterized protein n=1 Tax=Schistosoma margrebowiei TaxID=48269 RepID=A0A183MID7_9TREM|nr:unnamed protein product [Schistosoma margrebowiei]